MATANLEDLSKSLELSVNEKSPEESIRKTLRAYGFFKHCEPKASGKRNKTRENKRSVFGISEEDKKRTTQLVSHFKEGKEFHTLKEPRHLYGCTGSSTLQQQGCNQRLPFWPAEVECIRERPTHLIIPSKSSEPYYTPSHEMVPPKIRSGEGYGSVVYMNLPGPEKFYVKSRGGHSLNLPPTRTLSSADISLQFESRFESGNLSKAVQVGKWDYELYLRYDLYTKKHTQWFYFRIRNMRAGQTYCFTIVNLYKAGSLYNEGMQPVFYSEREAREQGLGWHRAGHNIKYFKTHMRRVNTKQETFCYGVTWSHTFKHSGDTCYFAHSFPYTYSNLQDYLQKILNNREKLLFCKYRVLCHSIAGNPVPLLTITSPSLTPNDSQAKRGVVVTARIHPGETNGSWMMKGLLDFLTSSADDAKIVRDLFVFKIIPMLNPDGVVVGNYRCSLSGRDLNRNYRSKLKDSYPTVWHTKHMVKRFCQEREVVLFCDLHGHSRKHNIFMYGCDALDDPKTRLRSRVFPRMLCKNAPDMFSYNSSRFVVQKSKESTGRVVMWREAGIQNSYTLEATFAGSTQGKLRGIQFTTGHLEDMGYHLCDTLLDYCDPDPRKTEKIMRELEDEYRRSVLTALAALGQELPPGVDPLDVKLDPALAEADSSDAGSDSSESDGPPVHLQWKQQKTKKKKKKLKSRKERNKQKALLKMNHQRVYSVHTAPIPPAAVLADSQSPEKAKREQREDTKSETVTQQSYDILSSHPLAHNGGIPTFVQERMEERQKRREEEDSSDVLVEIPSEQLRQTLLHIQATHTQQATSSTLFLPHPFCPMNISQAHMHNLSRRQSKLTGKISLPQLDSGYVMPPELPPLHPSSSSKGAFTSQYVAHHLQQVGNSAGGADNTSQNNTRNLSNLSRLFRQLRSTQILHSSQAQHDEQYPNATPQTALHGGEDKERHQQRDELQYRSGASNIAGNAEGNRIVSDTKFYVQSQNTSYSSTTPNVKIPPVAGAKHSVNVVKGNGSRCNSPMTSSWESFSKGMTLKDKQLGNVERDRKQLGDDKRDQMEVRREQRTNAKRGTHNLEVQRVLQDVQPPAEEDGERYQEFIDYLIKKQKGKDSVTERPVRTQPPAPRCNSPKFFGLPPDKTTVVPPDKTTVVMTQKLGNADANNADHTGCLHKRDSQNTHTLTRDYTTPPISKSKSDPLTSSKLLSPPPGEHTQGSQHSHQNAASTFTESVVRYHEIKTDGQGTRTWTTDHQQTKQTMKTPYNAKAETSTSLKASELDTTHQDTYMYESLQNTTEKESILHRMYSSKPPSRYGPRPGPGDGVPPSTVSLMLSRRPRSKSRPATMHSSRRPGKHAHIRYYTKRI